MRGAQWRLFFGPSQGESTASWPDVGEPAEGASKFRQNWRTDLPAKMSVLHGRWHYCGLQQRADESMTAAAPTTLAINIYRVGSDSGLTRKLSYRWNSVNAFCNIPRERSLRQTARSHHDSRKKKSNSHFLAMLIALYKGQLCHPDGPAVNNRLSRLALICRCSCK